MRRHPTDQLHLAPADLPRPLPTAPLRRQRDWLATHLAVPHEMALERLCAFLSTERWAEVESRRDGPYVRRLLL